MTNVFAHLTVHKIIAAFLLSIWNVHLMKLAGFDIWAGLVGAVLWGVPMGILLARDRARSPSTPT